jgi:hypothetical protein
VSTGSEVCRARIDDEENETILRHQGRSLFEELHLLFGVVCPSKDDIFENLFGAHAVTFSDGNEAIRAKTTLSIDIHGLALATALSQGKLASHTKRVAKLCFSASKFSKHLGSENLLKRGHWFDAETKTSVSEPVSMPP